MLVLSVHVGDLQCEAVSVVCRSVRGNDNQPVRDVMNVSVRVVVVVAALLRLCAGLATKQDQSSTDGRPGEVAGSSPGLMVF